MVVLHPFPPARRLGDEHDLAHDLAHDVAGRDRAKRTRIGRGMAIVAEEEVVTRRYGPASVAPYWLDTGYWLLQTSGHIVIRVPLTRAAQIGQLLHQGAFACFRIQSTASI